MGASATDPFISREMPLVGTWNSRSMTRVGLPGSPRRRSSRGAIFGPTPGSVLAGANRGSRIEGRNDIQMGSNWKGDGYIAAKPPGGDVIFDPSEQCHERNDTQ